MEAIPIYGLILIILVGAVAFLIGRLTSEGRKDNMRLEKELDESKKELKDYRSQVTSHFQETAHRVNALTENYRNVYEHLARGAQDLCDKNDAPQLMNELNNNPMLGSGKIEDTTVDHEVIATEADAKIDSDPDSEVGKTRENIINSTDSGNHDEPVGEEADQSADRINVAASDQTVDSDKNINDKRI
jgi:uncharacterized membrane-anchored protein YhcB (DUF1043 family)